MRERADRRRKRKEKKEKKKKKRRKGGGVGRLGEAPAGGAAWGGGRRLRPAAACGLAWLRQLVGPPSLGLHREGESLERERGS